VSELKKKENEREREKGRKEGGREERRKGRKIGYVAFSKLTFKTSVHFLFKLPFGKMN
jgi:hypothetical protein